MKSLSGLVLLCMCSASSAFAQDYMLIRIPKISIQEASLDEALKQVADYARESGAENKGFSGFKLVADKQGLKKRISLDLRDVPLGLAFKYIAGYEHMNVTTQDGVVVVYAKKEKINATIRFSDKFRKALGVEEAITKQEVIECLRYLKIDFSDADDVVLSYDQNLAILELNEIEANYLDSLLHLIEKGLPIERKRPSKSNHEKGKE